MYIQMHMYEHGNHIPCHGTPCLLHKKIIYIFYYYYTFLVSNVYLASGMPRRGECRGPVPMWLT
jgi:hypothetical protein